MTKNNKVSQYKLLDIWQVMNINKIIKLEIY